MSTPHFYQADEKYVQDVFGMRPKKEQHQTAIDINPVIISTLIILSRQAIRYLKYSSSNLCLVFFREFTKTFYFLLVQLKKFGFCDL